MCHWHWIGLIANDKITRQWLQVLAVDIDDKRLKIAKEPAAKPSIRHLPQIPYLQQWIFQEDVVPTPSSSRRLPRPATSFQKPPTCRKRGRVVLVGSVGLDLKRSDFFEKLTFQVSVHTGQGVMIRLRRKGLDYSVEFVRWTEQRNFEAVLDLMSMGMINAERFISSVPHY